MMVEGNLHRPSAVCNHPPSAQVVVALLPVKKTSVDAEQDLFQRSLTSIELRPLASCAIGRSEEPSIEENIK